MHAPTLSKPAKIKRPKWNFATEDLALILFQYAYNEALRHPDEEIKVAELFIKSWDAAEVYDRVLAVKKTYYSFSNTDYDQTKAEVLERDKYRCKKCGSFERPEVHHIIPIRVAPELFCDVWNMIVLCSDCHDLVAGRELEFRAEFQALVDQNGSA